MSQTMVGRSTSLISALFITARPRQWLKNVLVFAAPGAAGVLDEFGDLVSTTVVFVAFCLASSGTYFWNDVVDVERDRAHPTKCSRPIASGLVPLATARFVGIVLLLLAPVTATLVGRWQPVAVILVYEVLTLSYTAVWKHVAVVDLVVIAAGFVLRAAAGAVAVDVPMSSWFVMCISFGALFVVTGKRYAELVERGVDAERSRSLLAVYPKEYLQTVLAISCAGAILTYGLWAFESKGLRSADLVLFELSMVPVLVALLRYLLVLYRGRGAAPEDVFFSDRVLQVSGLSWVIIYGLAVYTS